MHKTHFSQQVYPMNFCTLVELSPHQVVENPPKW